MSNRRLIVVLLLIIAAAILGNELVSSRVRHPVKTRGESEFVDSTSDIDTIEIRRPGRELIRFERKGDWTMVKPYQARTDQSEMLKLVDALRNARYTDSKTEAELVRLGLSNAILGLEIPRLELRIGTEECVNAYLFGGYSASTNEVYVSGGDGSVMTLPASIYRALDVAPECFRDRDVLPVLAESVNKIEISRPGASVETISRNEDGWAISMNDGSGEMKAKNVSAQSVNGLVDRFVSASAIDFYWPTGATNESHGVNMGMLNDVLIACGLDLESAVSCSFFCNDEGVYRVLLGKSDIKNGDRVYALVHNGSTIVTLPAELKTLLFDDLKLISDPRLMPYDSVSIKSFTIARGSCNYVIARDDSGRWRLDSPVVAPADSEVAERFLERLLALSSTDKTDENEAFLRVSVNTNSDYAVKADSVLGSDTLEMLRSREIVRIDPKLVKRLVSTPENGKATPVVYSQEHASWRYEGEDPSVTVDGKAVTDVLSSLNPLMAVRVESLLVTQDMLPRYGLETPKFILAVDQFQEDAVRRNILVGASTEGGRFATVGSSDAVFVISEETFRSISGSLTED